MEKELQLQMSVRFKAIIEKGKKKPSFPVTKKNYATILLLCFNINKKIKGIKRNINS